MCIRDRHGGKEKCPELTPSSRYRIVSSRLKKNLFGTGSKITYMLPGMDSEVCDNMFWFSMHRFESECITLVSPAGDKSFKDEE